MYELSYIQNYKNIYDCQIFNDDLSDKRTYFIPAMETAVRDTFRQKYIWHGTSSAKEEPTYPQKPI
jgi:hypothetical protein